MVEHIPTISLAIASLNFALTWGLGFYVHIISKSKAANERISRLEEKTEETACLYGVRIARLEERMDATPSHEDLGKIYEKLNDVANSTARISGEIRHVSDVQKLILNRMAGAKDER